MALLLLFSSFIFAAPVTNLKGSLSVDQGALNYSVALDLPKGVAGVAPQISLNYSSNSGNGYLGQGWSIGGLSSISRCGSSLATDGHNRPVRLDDKDNFCMDGQRLISVGDNEYRTQIESYTKIVSVGTKGNPTSFKVWMKSGDVYEYNQVDSLSGKNITWLLSKISDRYGNDINFNYEKENNGTPKISSITYANNEIVFVYDSRKDTFSGFRRGKSFSVNKKLKKIEIKIDNQPHKQYELLYNAQSNSLDKLKLKSIKECIGDECTDPLTFEWQENSEKVSFEEEGNFPPLSPVKEEGVKLIDLNNDGFMDIYRSYTYGSGARMTRENNRLKYYGRIAINNGDGTFNTDNSPIKRTYLNNLKFVDLNGDGYIDIYEVDGGTDNIWLNDGNGKFTQSSHHPDIHANHDEIVFVDIDQDKNIDIYVTGKHSDTIWINNGQGLFYAKKTVENPNYTTTDYSHKTITPKIKK